MRLLGELPHISCAMLARESILVLLCLSSRGLLSVCCVVLRRQHSTGDTIASLAEESATVLSEPVPTYNFLFGKVLPL